MEEAGASQRHRRLPKAAAASQEVFTPVKRQPGNNPGVYNSMYMGNTASAH